MDANYKENEFGKLNHNDKTKMRLHEEGQQEKKKEMFVFGNKQTEIKGGKFFEEVFKEGNMIVIIKIVTEDKKIKTGSKGNKEKVGGAKKPNQVSDLIKDKIVTENEHIKDIGQGIGVIINYKENELNKTGSKGGKENKDVLLHLAEQLVSKTCSSGNIGQWQCYQ